jgi:hypothetical protein
VYLSVNCFDGEDSGREQLLALFTLRRDLEPRPSHDRARAAVAAMIAPNDVEEASRARTVRELYELIEALDRRVPQVERVGEMTIARAAAALKAEALKRIKELEPATAISART